MSAYSAGKSAATSIFCATCSKKVDARLTNGKEIYPHRPDLYDLPFWKCDECGNYVGCHHKTDNPTAPKGIISTAEIRAWRVKIHYTLDPLWKDGKISRKKAYAYLSKQLGYTYHTGNLRSAADAEKAFNLVLELKLVSIKGKKGGLGGQTYNRRRV